MGRWLSALVTLVLLGLAARALWVESAKFRLERVPQAEAAPSRLPSVLPAGDGVLLTLVPLDRVQPGDVIVFRHPLDVTHPIYSRVGEVTRVPGGTGYLVRLESDDPTREPWHAELHGAAWRVMLSGSLPAVVPPGFPTILTPWLVGAAGVALLATGAIAARRTRSKAARRGALVRSYRPDLW